MPRLFKIRTKVQFPPERLDFLASVQQTCFYHAGQIAKILRTASTHGVKTLADTWLAVVAHDTNRVMLYYLTKVVDPNAESNRKVVSETLPLVRSNLDVLKAMMPLFSMSKSLFEASANMVLQSGFGNQISAGLPNVAGVGTDDTERPTAPGTPVQSTPEYVLNPLAIYRLARAAVPEKEKHAPELIPSPETHATTGDTPGITKWAQPNMHPQNDQTQLAPPFVDINDVPHNGTPRSIPMSASDAGDLQMFFSSDFDTIWQPADTILESSTMGGIAPWDSRLRTGFDLDIFMPNYSWPLPEA